MSKLNVTDVKVLENPSPFNHQLAFEIHFEAYEDLAEDIEWKVTWVGSAESDAFDQILDEVVVGPIPMGRHQFILRHDNGAAFRLGFSPTQFAILMTSFLQCPPPDPSKIPAEELIGITVVMIIASYRKQEFARIGYYVNVDYADQDLKENPPRVPVIERLDRNILANNPRFTRCKIDWDDKAAAESLEIANLRANGQSTHIDIATPVNDENYYAGPK